MSPIRRATRVPFEEAVRCSNGEHRFDSRAVNISLSGIFLQTEEVQPVDAELDLEFGFVLGQQRERLHVRGKVYRASPDEAAPSSPTGMGVTFIGLDSRSRSLLMELIRQQDSAPQLLSPPTPAASSVFHDQVTPPAWQQNLPFFLVATLLGILGYVAVQVL